jgi:hypothetical protein
MQQQAVRAFLRSVRSELCSAPGAAHDARAYQGALLALLPPLRRAIARHVHAAFFIKAACAAAHEKTYAPASDFVCTRFILKHEPQNVAEGDLIVRLTTFLLRQGPGFCSNVDVRLRPWEEQLEAAMASHWADTHFHLLTDRWVEMCEREHGSDLSGRTQRELVASGAIEKMKSLTEARLNGCCNQTDVGCAMGVDEMLSSVGNDTELLLGMAKHAMVGMGLPFDRCVDHGSDAGSAGGHARSSAIEGLRRLDTGADQRGADFLSYFLGRDAASPDIMTKSDIVMDWLAVHLMFGVAYHKHSPLCGRPELGRRRSPFGALRWMQCGERGLFNASLTRCRSRDGEYNSKGSYQGKDGVPSNCRYGTDGRLPYMDFFAAYPFEYHGSTPDALTVFDLVFTDDTERCGDGGEACAMAAEAIEGYLDLLGRLRRLRTNLLFALFPKPYLGDLDTQRPLLSTLARGSEWLRQRLWDEGDARLDAFVQRLKRLDRTEKEVDEEQQCIRDFGASCAALQSAPAEPPPCTRVDELLSDMHDAKALLAAVLPKLRAASNALEVRCIAAERPTSYLPFLGYPTSSCGRCWRQNADGTRYDYGYVNASRGAAHCPSEQC